MQTALFKIWTRVAESTSNEDKRDVTSAPNRYATSDYVNEKIQGIKKLLTILKYIISCKIIVKKKCIKI